MKLKISSFKRCITCATLFLISSLLVACGGGSEKSSNDLGQAEAGVQKQSVIEAPLEISQSSLPSDSFKAKIFVDDEEIPTVIEGGHARADLKELPNGSHTIRIEYYYDVNGQDVIVATATETITVTNTSERSFSFNKDSYELLDFDNDGDSNLKEFESGTFYNFDDSELPTINLTSDHAKTFDDKKITLVADISRHTDVFTVHSWQVIGYSDISVEVDVDESSERTSVATFTAPHGRHELMVEFRAQTEDLVWVSATVPISVYKDDLNDEGYNTELRDALCWALRKRACNDGELFSLDDFTREEREDGEENGITLSKNQINVEIDSLAGIEDFVSLKSFRIVDQPVTSLEPLAGLSELESLSIVNAPELEDLSPIASLTKLKVLDMEAVSVRDLSPISELTELTKLRFVDNELRTLSALENLINLEYLDLSTSPGAGGIFDISLLENLSKLKVLNLTNHKVTDLSPLANTTELVRVELAGNQNGDVKLSDITPLSGNLNLEWLDVESNSVREVSFLSNMSKMDNLQLKENNIEDVSALSSLTEMTFLSIAENPITELPVFDADSKLDYLNITELEIADISSLSVLSQLTTLYASSTVIEDFSPLQNLVTLNDLRLNNAGLDDTQVLRNLTALTHLELNNNKVSTIDDLSLLTNLEELELDYQDPDMLCRDLDQLESALNISIGKDGCSSITSFSIPSEILDLPESERSNIAAAIIIDDEPYSVSLNFDNGTASVDLEGVDNGELTMKVKFYVEAAILAETSAVIDYELRPEDIADEFSDYDYDFDTDNDGYSNYIEASNPSIFSSVHQFDPLLPVVTYDVPEGVYAEKIFSLSVDLSNVNSERVHTETWSVLLEGVPVEPEQGQDLTYLAPAGPAKLFVQYTLEDDLGGKVGREFTIQVFKEDLNNPDANPDLYARVRRALNLEENANLEVTHLAVQTLDLSALPDLKVSDLTGIDDFANLVDLNLTNNEVSSLEPLSGLENLRILNLDNNSYTDLSPLADLEGLEELYLNCDETGEKDGYVTLAPLVGLTTLKHFAASHCEAPSIFPLRNNVGLESIYLEYMPISLLVGLENMTQLTSLELSNIDVTDLSVVAGFTELNYVSLVSVAVEDYSVFQGLEKLGHFESRNSGLDNLSYIVASKDSIHKIHLSESNLDSLEGLETFANLERLFLTSIFTPLELTYDDNGVTKRYLADKPLLWEVSFNYSNITDLEGLRDITTITELFLVRSLVEDITALSTLPALERLEMFDIPSLDLTDQTQLAVFSDLDSVETLKVSYNNLTDISTLAEMDSLKYLHMFSMTQLDLTDVAQQNILAGMDDLAFLHIFGVPIDNLSVFEEMDSLVELRLGGFSSERAVVTDYQPLLNIPMIQEIELTGPMSDLDCSSVTSLAADFLAAQVEGRIRAFNFSNFCEEN